MTPTEEEKHPSSPVMVIASALFPVGRLLGTPGSEAALKEAGVPLTDLLIRHLTGDWGDLDEEDRKANDEAVASGEDRIFSAYTLQSTNQTIWIITEADRSATTALLPEEY